MTPHLAGHAHGLEVPNHNGAIDTTRSQIVTASVEAQACCMTRANRTGDVLRIVLKEVIVREEQIHLGDNKRIFALRLADLVCFEALDL
jgi:hypothetical protein